MRTTPVHSPVLRPVHEDEVASTPPPMPSLGQSVVGGITSPANTTSGSALSRTMSPRRQSSHGPGDGAATPSSSSSAGEREDYHGNSYYFAGGVGTGYNTTTGSGGPPSRAPSRTGSISRYGLSGQTIAKPDTSETKLCLCMVGLPARGKSYLSNRLMRYLRWLEYEVRVFNVGQLRRAKAKQELRETGVKAQHNASFFDNTNEQAAQAREALAVECLESLITWLKTEGGNVGVFDATNSNSTRRRKIVERLRQEPSIKLIFLESICTDPSVIAANIAVKVASGDPDYDGMDKQEAERDFKARIKTYEVSYQELGTVKGEENYSYCKIM